MQSAAVRVLSRFTLTREPEYETSHWLLQSYPEFCRALYDAAPAEFNMAVMDWEAAHGKVRHALTHARQ